MITEPTRNLGKMISSEERALIRRALLAYQDACNSKLVTTALSEANTEESYKSKVHLKNEIEDSQTILNNLTT